MKRILLLVLALMVVMLVGCSQGEAPVDSPEAPEAPQTTPSENLSNSVEVDGIIYTVDSVTVENVTGDRTADNYGDPNGEYISLQDGLVKASDYKCLTWSYTIKNTTDKAWGYILGWDVYLPDGYRIPQLEVLSFSELTLSQIPSHSSKTLMKELIIEKSLEFDTVILHYTHMNYDEEYWNDFGKIMSGTMSQQQYLDKYENKMKEIAFTMEAQ